MCLLLPHLSKLQKPQRGPGRVPLTPQHACSPSPLRGSPDFREPQNRRSDVSCCIAVGKSHDDLTQSPRTTRLSPDKPPSARLGSKHVTSPVSSCLQDDSRPGMWGTDVRGHIWLSPLHRIKDGRTARHVVLGTGIMCRKQLPPFPFHR